MEKMYFTGIVIFPVLLLNVLIVTMCKKKDFKRYILLMEIPTKNIFF